MSTGSCLAVQRLPRTSRYYPEGIQKVVYVRYFWHMSAVRFVECTFSGLPMRPYYRQQCTSTRPSVRPIKSPNYPSSVLSDPKLKLIPPTKLLMLS
jgi:hypothetical protein